MTDADQVTDVVHDDSPAADDVTAGVADDVTAGVADDVTADPADDGFVDVIEESLSEPAPPKPESPFDRPGKWYVLHTQSGYENKVRQNIEARIRSMNIEAKVHEVVIPMQDQIELKQGKKVVVQKKVFPGYLLVRCALDDESWSVIRNTPGVTGFAGPGNKPLHLRRREVEDFLGTGEVEEAGVETAGKGGPKKLKIEFDVGDPVRVKDGPFADFDGLVTEINEDHLKLKVLVNIFGRETPLELNFAQVAKI